MAEQQGSDHDTCLDHGQAFDLPALISPLVAGVIFKDVRRCAGDFAATVPAIVLCADLSGFSIAWATLTRSEARGAQELRGIFNAVFGRVTDAIQSAGGQILQFSGDAVTAAWPCANDAAAQTRCAIAAGLALQEACRKLSVAGMADLKMRVTLAQGEVWIALLAKGLAAREPLICGDVFDRLRFSGFSFRGTDDLPALAALANDLGQAIDNKGGV